MRRIRQFGIVAVLIFAATAPVVLAQSGLGTAFSYQGRLAAAGAPITGTADLQFTLYDSATAGIQIGSVVTLSAQTLVGGLFTASLDFGAAAFNGDARWLEIAVRSPAGNGAFTTLSPRQAVTAAPYALQTRGIFVGDNNWIGLGTTSPAGFLDVSPPGGAAIPTFIRSGSGSDGAGDIPNPLTPATPGGTLTLVGGQGGGSHGFFVPSAPGGDVLVNGGLGGYGHFGEDGGKGGRVILRPGLGGGFDLGGTSLGPGVVWVDGRMGVKTNTPANFFSVAGNADFSGSVGVGTASPQTILHVKGNGGLVDIEGTDQAYLQFYPFGFASGRKAYIGTPGANSTGFNVANEISGGSLNLIASTVQVFGNFVNTSDARYKRDVRDIGDALALVSRLHGVRYRWDAALPDGTALPDGEQVGFLAQEVEKVLPELVKTDADGRKGVSYVGMVPLLTEAIKQEQKELAARQHEIDALKLENERNQKRLATLEAQMAKLLEGRAPLPLAEP